MGEDIKQEGGFYGVLEHACETEEKDMEYLEERFKEVSRRQCPALLIYQEEGTGDWMVACAGIDTKDASTILANASEALANLRNVN